MANGHEAMACKLVFPKCLLAQNGKNFEREFLLDDRTEL